MIRAKLLKCFKEETINMRTIFDDEKIKVQPGQVCNYYGSNEKLALNQIFSEKYGGKDDAENLFFCL
jgi:tRNA U34 2-thiouridine synthase MnmA/TrmU